MILAELSQSSSISEGDIHVEITAPEHEQTMYYAAPKDPSLSRTWDFVRPTVHDCLQSFQATRGRMTTTITLFRYGVLPDLRDNPLTIYISVDFGPDETRWYEVISDIKNMLQGVAGWNQVQVHMENNEGMQSSFD
ncbi:uncharacterized protein BKA55DRAFT_587937 [Fusarium redolens]|uniref:Uncharacterized protein n=1 Tax=Fusarium redolens TaxID=48865 RepID=A0A9P9KVF6_FUSRE|nr:uncharacterized protein BKA55DRAFT_587937 [Fusarium redolens]KAH7269118.1 hypothetical protein BKA55DRAFT_587937 [Fusarium redolens]